MNDMQRALALLDKARHLVISYAGFIIQEPDIFPQPRGYVVAIHVVIVTLIVNIDES